MPKPMYKTPRPGGGLVCMALKSASKRTWQVDRYRNAMSALRPFIAQFQTWCCSVANVEMGQRRTRALQLLNVRPLGPS